MTAPAPARRRLARHAAVAAGSLVALAGLYALVVYAGGWIMSRGVLLLSEGLVWMAVSTAEGVDLWALAAQIGGGVGDVLTTPAGAGALIGLEVVAVLALFALHRALRPRADAGESREARK